MKFGQIATGDRACLRHSNSLIDGERLVVNIIHHAGEIRIPIGSVCQITVGIIRLRHSGGRRCCCRHTVNFGDFRHALQGGKFIHFRHPQRID